MASCINRLVAAELKEEDVVEKVTLQPHEVLLGEDSVPLLAKDVVYKASFVVLQKLLWISLPKE